MDWSNVDNKSALCCKLPVGEVAVPRLASTESRVSVAVPPQEAGAMHPRHPRAGSLHALAGPDV